VQRIKDKKLQVHTILCQWVSSYIYVAWAEVYFHRQYLWNFAPPPAISFHWTTAKRVHYTQCLCVSIVLQCIWVVTGTPSLSLAAKEVFKGVLANVQTQECQLIVLHLWKGEQVPHHAQKSHSWTKRNKDTKWPLMDSEVMKSE